MLDAQGRDKEVRFALLRLNCAGQYDLSYAAIFANVLLYSTAAQVKFGYMFNVRHTTCDLEAKLMNPYLLKLGSTVGSRLIRGSRKPEIYRNVCYAGPILKSSTNTLRSS
jgi:hypothetical protein